MPESGALSFLLLAKINAKAILENKTVVNKTVCTPCLLTVAIRFAPDGFYC